MQLFRIWQVLCKSERPTAGLFDQSSLDGRILAIRPHLGDFAIVLKSELSFLRTGSSSASALIPSIAHSLACWQYEARRSAHRLLSRLVWALSP